MNNLLMKKSLMLSMTIILILVILLSRGGSAMAQVNGVAPVGNVPTASSQALGPTNPAELEAFLDDLFGKQMEENHIAGAAISVVKDGKLFFAKGYGYADIEKGIPVNVEQTVFRIGSIGKTFTATAVMQLVEQGKLDLDADINTYLDFRIPNTYPQPITLKHLMTHTSGFEDRLFGTVILDANDLVPAREWLIAHMSTRVRPPGDSAAYANYNAMLAGYIVARVSGQPYDQYIQEHIFNPLGMVHSTAQSSIPPDLRSYASKGYTYADGVFQVFPNYVVQQAGLPSGAIQSSATDMARFMIAHLQGGHYSDATIPDTRILKETTAQQMHSTTYAPDPRLLGIAYGLFDFSDNGRRTIANIGYSPPMNSVLLLLPDQNLGVFVTYNSAGASDLTSQHLGFQRAFFDHYYPASAVEPIQPPADFTERADRFVGNYRQTQGSHTTMEKIAGLFGAVEIRDSGDGALLLTTPYGEWRFVEVQPLFFRQADGPFRLVFREDDRGRINHMSTDLMPQFAFDRLNWYETPRFNIELALGCILIFLTMIPVATIRFIRNRRLSDDRKSAPRGVRVAYWIILGMSLLNLLFLVGFALGLPAIEQNILLDPPLVVKIALGMGVVAAVLTVGALVYTALAWKNRYWGITFRAYYTLVTIAATAFVWFLNYWNLLGWRY
jgi:CubicO group peptidase (beta-lactamase class C family)